MLEQVLKELRNWFQVGIYPGEYTIQDGGITLPFLREGQYFRICGSVFSDGLHRCGPDMEYLKDETFNGTIWALAVPSEVLKLAEEIEEWKVKYQKIIESPYTSESFGGYSYSKASGTSDNVASGGWEKVFHARLDPYRRLREV